MRNNKLVRNIGLAALVLVALGVAGYAANGGGTSTHDTVLGLDEGAMPEDGLDANGVFASEGSTGVANSVAPTLAQPARDSVASQAGGAGASKSTPPGQAPPAPDALGDSLDRKIVQTASIQLQVKEVGASFEDVGRIATGAGGFVASSSFSYKGEQQFASMTIRVPSDQYQSVLGSLRSLGVKVDAEDSKAQDATEEYTDLTSRLRTLQATQDQLMTLLGKATSISDILTVHERLNDVTGQIEQVKGRMQLLDNLSDLATITVHLRPEAGAAKVSTDNGVDLGAKVSEAWDDSLDFLGGILGGVVTVVVFAWWVPLVGIPLLVGLKLFNRHHPPAMGAVD
jgi:hypothetical protein